MNFGTAGVKVSPMALGLGFRGQFDRGEAERVILSALDSGINLIDCAKYRIPAELISMPLSGFMAPVTIVGSLIQHTAEALSGIVISQTLSPGTPILYGGSDNQILSSVTINISNDSHLILRLL